MTRQSGAHQIVVGTTLNATIQSGSRKGRRNYPIEKQLAIAACAPGVSVARLALDNGINANMLHKWRRTYLASEVGARETAPSTFVEVRIMPATNPVAPLAIPLPVDIVAPKATREPRQTIQPGVIEISLATTALRLEGTVDAAILAQVLRHFHA